MCNGVAALNALVSSLRNELITLGKDAPDRAPPFIETSLCFLISDFQKLSICLVQHGTISVFLRLFDCCIVLIRVDGGFQTLRPACANFPCVFIDPMMIGKVPVSNNIRSAFSCHYFSNGQKDIPDSMTYAQEAKNVR